MVESRLEHLPEQMRNVLVAGAVLGGFDPPALLSAVAGSDAETAARALQRGIDVGLLQTRAGAIAFRHDLIGEAVLDATVPHVAKAMHRQAAAALTPGTDDARRGAHLAAADEHDAAAQVLATAALSEVRRNALLSAEHLSRQAIDVAATAGARAQASDALASVLSAAGRWKEALALDQSSVRESGETSQRRLRMALSALEAGNVDLARDALSQTSSREPAERVLAARVALVSGHASEALEQVESVLTGELDTDTRLSALDMKARALDFLGERVGAEQTWTLQASEAAAHGRTQSELRAIFQLGKLDFFDGRPPARLWRAVELARQGGALVELAWAEETLAIALTLQGHPAAALEVLDVAIPRARELHLDQLGYLLTARAGAWSFVRVDKTVEDLFAEAESVAPAPEIRMMQLALRADIAVHSGRFEEALVHLKHADQMVSAMPGAAPVDSGGQLAWVYIALGQHDDAKAALSRTAAIPDLARWHPRPVVVKAGRALLEGDAAGVDAAIAAARGPMPFSIAMMRVIGSIVFEGAPRLRWLREALDIYEATGATAYLGRARQLLREAGGAVPRRRPAPDAIPEVLARHGVTAREADVLRLLGGGLSNADIAARLFVSVRTVETHVSSLLGKLNVRGRGQLIALCANLEWNVN
jgi:DNA-binding CsgD family transcriptional regulator/tetratricopeptide (TPR) repeat protein